MSGTASIQSLAQGNVTIGTYWLDVERGTNWSTVSSNVAFIHEWVAAAQTQLASHPQLGCNTVGIYTRERDRNEITGGITDYGSLPLWWIMVLFNPNGERSFDDFKPFAGWSKAEMVQWTANQTSATNLGYDGNWRPGPVSTSTTSTPPAATTTTPPQVYTVAAGDTLDSVAARFTTTRADLAHANDLINPADFKPGLVVKIP